MAPECSEVVQVVLYPREGNAVEYKVMEIPA